MVNNKIFLYDAAGAMFSVVCLFVIYFLNTLLGMTASVVSIFIGIGILLCIYSLVCYVSKPQRWRMYLKILAGLNFAYCLFTISQLIKYAQSITLPGYIYFVLEILIVFILSMYEFRISLKPYSPKNSTAT